MKFGIKKGDTWYGGAHGDGWFHPANLEPMLEGVGGFSGKGWEQIIMGDGTIFPYPNKLSEYLSVLLYMHTQKIDTYEIFIRIEAFGATIEFTNLDLLDQVAPGIFIHPGNMLLHTKSLIVKCGDRTLKAILPEKEYFSGWDIKFENCDEIIPSLNPPDPQYEILVVDGSYLKSQFEKPFEFADSINQIRKDLSLDDISEYSLCYFPEIIGISAESILAIASLRKVLVITAKRGLLENLYESGYENIQILNQMPLGMGFPRSIRKGLFPISQFEDWHSKFARFQ